ncbi:hypothetical protein BZG02_02095 [Labilibaculum filiforme]|uniref:Uncharacterized protein n=1 Tax=Labilibaculum filiforme TaxID=1940526 RepID=A0A2N3I687_9BACT|nr:hypothetical protein [Labilibaculum filiforme]PKQ65817.1 hypothetical protein BZG02_02095 [Labilibaculum filiforme]
MQIRLVFPFIDLRKLHINQKRYVTDKPEWTAIQTNNSFVRCLGDFNNQFTECSLKRGISLYTPSTHSFTVRKRTLNFPYGNSTFGQYYIVLDFYRRKSNRMSTEEIIKMLGSDLKITIKYLFDNPRQTHPINQKTRKSVNIFDLKQEIHSQYYLSTIRFEEKKNKRKITNPNPSDSKSSIHFLNPLISIDNSTYLNQRIGNTQYIPLDINVAVGMKQYRNIVFYDFRRKIGPLSFTRTKKQKANEIINAWLLFSSGFLSCFYLLSKIQDKKSINEIEASICIESVMNNFLFSSNPLKNNTLKCWYQHNENNLILNGIIQQLKQLTSLSPAITGSFENKIQNL